MGSTETLALKLVLLSLSPSRRSLWPSAGASRSPKVRADVISELSELDDLRRLARLLADIWGRDGEPPISSDTLRALSISGNYVAGAHVGDRLVGGLVGWFGGSPPHGLHLHSHILGVVEDSQVRGLGFELKQHQRHWCLDRGVKVAEWTFDPLVRRNAYFNLGKLGAQARRYLVDFYGAMADGINAGDESDRLLVNWQLDSVEADAAASGKAQSMDVQELTGKGAAPVLSVGDEERPEPHTSSASILLCQVPADIVEIRRSNPKLAHLWRISVRSAMTHAFDGGYRVSGVTRSGWYVLER